MRAWALLVGVLAILGCVTDQDAPCADGYDHLRDYAADRGARCLTLWGDPDREESCSSSLPNPTARDSWEECCAEGAGEAYDWAWTEAGCDG